MSSGAAAWVSLLFEDGGRPLPRHRLAMQLEAHAGRLVLRTGRVEALRQSVLVAHLVDLKDPTRDILPPLYGAHFAYSDDMEARIDGLELNELDRKFAAQAWHVKFSGYAKRDPRCL